MAQYLNFLRYHISCLINEAHLLRRIDTLSGHTGLGFSFLTPSSMGINSLGKHFAVLENETNHANI